MSLESTAYHPSSLLKIMCKKQHIIQSSTEDMLSLYEICAKVCENYQGHACRVCVCPASSQASVWIHSIPLYCVCEYRAEPFISYDKWSCTLQTCTFSTQLNGPLRSLNIHSLGGDTGRDSAVRQTQRGLSGGTVPHTVACNTVGGSSLQV